MVVPAQAPTEPDSYALAFRLRQHGGAELVSTRGNAEVKTPVPLD